MASPLRKTPSDLAKPVCQSWSDISVPPGVNQPMSLTSLAADRAALEPAAAAEDGMLRAQPDQVAA